MIPGGLSGGKKRANNTGINWVIRAEGQATLGYCDRIHLERGGRNCHLDDNSENKKWT